MLRVTELDSVQQLRKVYGFAVPTYEDLATILLAVHVVGAPTCVRRAYKTLYSTQCIAIHGQTT